MKDLADNQTVDWIGIEASKRRRAIFKDTRDAIAEQKAVALLQLGELINHIPPRIKSGGTVADVREWKASRTSAAKIAANSRSSVNDLNSAINNMRRFW